MGFDETSTRKQDSKASDFVYSPQADVLSRTSQASRAVHVGFTFDFVPSGAEAGDGVDGEGEHGVHLSFRYGKPDGV